MMEEEVDDSKRHPSATPDGAASVQSVEIHDTASPSLASGPPSASVSPSQPGASVQEGQEPLSPQSLARDLSAPESNAEAEDGTGLATVQSGLWGLWSTVSSVGVVRAAVSTARQVTDRAVEHVKEHGLVRSALDGAQAAVESAKRVDSTLLHGAVSKLVDSTLQAAHKGVDRVREHLPATEEQHEGPGFVITSTAFEKVNALRIALQGKYGDVSLRALSTASGVAPQPVGFAAGMRGAENRIASLRSQNGVRPGDVIVSIENFLVEPVPDLWTDVAAVVLRDDAHDITVRTFSQSITARADIVAKARAATGPDYSLRETGFAVTHGELMHEENRAVSASDWHATVSGVSRQSQLHVACVVALGEYAVRLQAITAAATTTTATTSATTTTTTTTTTSSSSSSTTNTNATSAPPAAAGAAEAATAGGSGGGGGESDVTGVGTRVDASGSGAGSSAGSS